MQVISIYTAVGVLAGLVVGILGAMTVGFLYVIFFGLFFAGDKTIGIATIGFYIAIILAYLLFVILGGIFGYRYGKKKESSAEEQGKLIIRGSLLLISLLILLVAIIFFYIYFERLPSVEADVDIDTLIGGLVPGTYKIYASVQELNLTCFCPDDVQCKLCKGESYIILQDKTGHVRAHLSLDSSKNIRLIENSSIFVIEKKQYDKNQYFYLVDYH